MNPISIVGILILGILARPGSAVDAGQFGALMDIYSSTGGSSWINNTGWALSDQSEVCSSWFGVACDSSLNVISINMPSNMVSGPLPSTISNLVSLQSIILSHNSITSFPATMLSIPGLRYLELDSNLISGPIPDSIGNPSLSDVNLSNNDLTDHLPSAITRMTSIQFLNLGFNHLSGSIPSWLGNLTSIQSLLLNNNQFAGSIPSDLVISNVQYFDLSHNFLSGMLPSTLADFQGIQYLYLNDNNFEGHLSDSLTSLASLRSLEVQNNQLSGELPTVLGTSLTEVRFDNNRFCGSTLPTYCDPPAFVCGTLVPCSPNCDTANNPFQKIRPSIDKFKVNQGRSIKFDLSRAGCLCAGASCQDYNVQFCSIDRQPSNGVVTISPNKLHMELVATPGTSGTFSWEYSLCSLDDDQTYSNNQVTFLIHNHRPSTSDIHLMVSGGNLPSDNILNHASDIDGDTIHPVGLMPHPGSHSKLIDISSMVSSISAVYFKATGGITVSIDSTGSISLYQFAHGGVQPLSSTSFTGTLQVDYRVSDGDVDNLGISKSSIFITFQ